jgi:hypothetical protein
MNWVDVMNVNQSQIYSGELDWSTLAGGATQLELLICGDTDNGAFIRTRYSFDFERPETLPRHEKMAELFGSGMGQGLAVLIGIAGLFMIRKATGNDLES